MATVAAARVEEKVVEFPLDEVRLLVFQSFASFADARQVAALPHQLERRDGDVCVKAGGFVDRQGPGQGREERRRFVAVDKDTLPRPWRFEDEDVAIAAQVGESREDVTALGIDRRSSELALSRHGHAAQEGLATMQDGALKPAIGVELESRG